MQIKIFNKTVWLKKPHFREFWPWVRSFPWFPVLLPIYTILFFLEHNIAQVDYHAADRLLWAFSICTLLLMLVLKFVFRDIQRAAWVVFVFGLIFFTYPHIKFVLQEKIPFLVKFNILLPGSLIFWPAVCLPRSKSHGKT